MNKMKASHINASQWVWGSHNRNMVVKIFVQFENWTKTNHNHSCSTVNMPVWVIFSISLTLICYARLMIIKLNMCVCVCPCPCVFVRVPVCVSACFPQTVSQQSGMLSNLGTTISSPNSEPDNHALLDEKEDSYFSEIRNFISNSEMNQASSSTDKRYAALKNTFPRTALKSDIWHEWIS